jgi:uncharacterized protein (UPF0276 family)
MTAVIDGAGVGLRTPHIQTLLACEKPLVPWLELLADNWFAKGGLDRTVLQEACERYPVVLHGVGLSLGAADPLDVNYLQHIKQLKQETGAVWYSEHCSFSVHKGMHMPDLLPLPYTAEAVEHISQRIVQVQDVLQERILLENVSSYLQFNDNEMREGEFMRAVAETADCDLLLDINNCYVSEFNNQASVMDYFADIPVERVKQIHLAGFERKDNYLLDAHNNPVDEQVWYFFNAFIEQYGTRPTLIEWDNDIPPFKQLLAEQQAAQARLDRVRLNEKKVINEAA